MKNATTNVDVLMIAVPNSDFGYKDAIIGSVCQDVITPTDISSKSIVVIVASRLWCRFCVRYAGALFDELFMNGSYRQCRLFVRYFNALY